MKNLLVLGISLFLITNLVAQPSQLLTGDPTDLTGFSSLPSDVKPLFKKAFYAASCELINPMTGKCDLETSNPFPSEKVTASNTAKKKAFVALESAIRNGQGRNILPKSYLQDATSKNPGNNLKVLKKRFIFIITRMESETEDE